MAPNWPSVIKQHGGSVEVCFLVCIDCGNETTASNPPQYPPLTDDEAERIFHERGWTITPTRCPKCVARAGGDRPLEGERDGTRQGVSDRRH